MRTKAVDGRKPWLAEETVKEWFRRAVGANADSIPDAVYLRLSRDLQIAVNRAYNVELRSNSSKEIPICRLRDVDLKELIASRLEAVQAAAGHLLYTIERAAEYLPIAEQHRGSPSLDEIRQIIERMSAVPNPITSLSSRKRGRHNARWQPAGRAWARLVRDVLQAHRITRSLSISNKDGPVAFIGAAAMREVYDIALEAEGFATAMKRRDRATKRRPKAMEERFPHAARLKSP